MAIWPFNRKNRNQQYVPEEIQEYYQAERRERVGIAWLLALGTLIATVLLAIGLFFGGRWAYRAIFDENDTQTAQPEDAPQTADNSPSEDSENNDSQDEEDRSDDEDREETPAPAEEDEEEPALPGDDTEDEEEAESPPRTNRPARSDAEEDEEEPLPNTGPGDVAALFAVTTAVSAAGHHIVTTRRQKD